MKFLTRNGQKQNARGSSAALIRGYERLRSITAITMEDKQAHRNNLTVCRPRSPPPLSPLDSGHIEEHVIEKNEKLAAESGKAGFGLAYVMDGLKESASVVSPSTLLTRSSSPQLLLDHH